MFFNKENKEIEREFQIGTEILSGGKGIYLDLDNDFVTGFYSNHSMSGFREHFNPIIKAQESLGRKCYFVGSDFGALEGTKGEIIGGEDPWNGKKGYEEFRQMLNERIENGYEKEICLFILENEFFTINGFGSSEPELKVIKDIGRGKFKKGGVHLYYCFQTYGHESLGEQKYDVLLTKAQDKIIAFGQQGEPFRTKIIFLLKDLNVDIETFHKLSDRNEFVFIDKEGYKFGRIADYLIN